MQGSPFSASKNPLQGMNLLKMFTDRIQESVKAQPQPNGSAESALLQRLAADLAELSAIGLHQEDTLANLGLIMTGFSNLKAQIDASKKGLPPA